MDSVISIRRKNWDERLVLGSLRKYVYTMGHCSERADKGGCEESCTLSLQMTPIWAGSLICGE